MNKLRVGMRVRILYSNSWPELAGQEGTITEKAHGVDSFGCERHWYVAPDCWGSSYAPYKGKNGGLRFSPNSSQLEPIVPDSYRVVSWKDCLWMPESMKETI